MVSEKKQEITCHMLAHLAAFQRSNNIQTRHVTGRSRCSSTATTATTTTGKLVMWYKQGSRRNIVAVAAEVDIDFKRSCCPLGIGV